MSQQQVPPQIMYGNFRPKGYYTQFKQWPITPMSSNQYWQPDQIVRFLITIKNGVMDPYRSHLQMQVNYPLQAPVGSLQVDSSSQSFISQTVVSSNNTQIQRITQYDSLAAYLTDIGFSQYVCQSRQVQGIGYSNMQTNSPYSYNVNGTQQYLVSNTNLDGSFYYQSVQAGLISPTRVPIWSGKTGTQRQIKPSVDVTLLQNSNTNGFGGGVPTLGNWLWQKPANFKGDFDRRGRFNNLRCQYATSILQNTYVDANNSILQTSPGVLGQTYDINNLNGDSPTSGFNPKNPYKIYNNTKQNTNKMDLATGKQYIQEIPLVSSLYGYQKPYASQFNRGSNQPFISSTVPQCQMKNGIILTTKVPVSTQLFRMPLISTVCGVLIPNDQFLLIPIKALYNLLLQVTLSKYAMFTSGYCDVHQFDKYGMKFMQPRKWTISQISWNLHLYTFSDEGINRSIQASLVKGIPISSTSYVLASQFQLSNGQNVRNSWPIGSQSQSLCQIICLFLSNEYMQYTFCRKQFRLSNCINSMQIKFNTQFYPSQPVIGNAGNPQILDETGDCWPFYELLLLSSNYMFNTNIPLPKINMKNFAINKRIYNPANKQTLYDENMLNNPSYVFTQNSVNMDTAMGMSSFHQNRYIGKAAFVYSFQPYGHSKQYMTGLNTQGVQNFSIIFGSNNAQPYPNDQTLLIFTRQNILVIYTQNGVQVIGN